MGYADNRKSAFSQGFLSDNSDQGVFLNATYEFLENYIIEKGNGLIDNINNEFKQYLTDEEFERFKKISFICLKFRGCVWVVKLLLEYVFQDVITEISYKKNFIYDGTLKYDGQIYYKQYNSSYNNFLYIKIENSLSKYENTKKIKNMGFYPPLVNLLIN